MNKCDIPSKELLANLMNSLGSMGKVASELSKPYGTVRAWFNKYGLNRPKSCRNMFHELRQTPISDVHKSVILGSVLGDGCLYIPKHGKNAKLSIKHCTRQKPYLGWKKRLMDPFSRKVYQTSKPGEVEICGIKSFSTGSFAFTTISHPGITEFYKRYYRCGKKGVNIDVIEELDLLSLAIWIGDDGSFYYNKFNKIEGGKICTNSFSYKEQLLLVEALRPFYRGRLSIIPVKNKSEFMIKLTSGKCATELVETVKSVLPKSVHFKFEPQRLQAKLLKSKDEDIV